LHHRLKSELGTPIYYAVHSLYIIPSNWLQFLWGVSIKSWIIFTWVFNHFT